MERMSRVADKVVPVTGAGSALRHRIELVIDCGVNAI
jgi:hypothetical protein